MTRKILFVDDEPMVLDGYRRTLHREFDVDVAPGGAQGLDFLRQYGPYAVVISDMRMPGMNGAEFLAQVREKAPETVRMLLTGYTDIGAAIDAVNEGNIFRFLTKPCEKEVLVKAINIGLLQYRSVSAERELVKKVQMIERARAEQDTADACTWDNFGSPTGLPGPTQAREYLMPLFGVDPQYYVILVKLTLYQTVVLRYGEGAANGYLKIAAQSLMQSLRSDDRLFHWGQDVVMAVVRRQLPPAAVRMEIARRTSVNRQHLIEVDGRSIMLAGSTTFDLLPVSKFSALDDMMTAFGSNLVESK